MSTISQLGTFDVENYGDLLYPVVFQRLLERRDASLSVRQYSPPPGRAPQEAGFATRSARSLFEPGQAEPRRLLVVGGGDMLRADYETVAAPYSKIHRSYLGGLGRAVGAAGPLHDYTGEHSALGRWARQRWRRIAR